MDGAISVRKYNELCTPEILEEIAADKAAEFKHVSQSNFHEVYPNILIGGESIALDKYVLEEIGVSHVVNCAQGKDPEDVNTDARYYKGTRIKLYAIRAKDEDGNRIMPFFHIASAYISRALEAGGKVLVHCRTGVSLSPTIVIAYLMIERHLDVRDAFRHVRSQRTIAPNSGFRKQLCDLNEQLLNSREAGIIKTKE